MAAPRESTEKETGRLEAFSDGVFAIAITLLILEIRVPQLSGDITSVALFQALAKLWPSAIALLLSFFVVLLMWINHHELMRIVGRVDQFLMFTNGLLLLMVTVVPFPTALLAQYLSTKAANAAAATYCGAFVLISVAYNLVFASIASGRRLVRPEISDETLSKIRRTYYLGLAVYAASTLIAWWNAKVGLAVYGALRVVWARLGYRDRARSHTALQ